MINVRRSSANQLQAIITRLEDVGDGTLLEQLEKDLGTTALRLARLGFLRRHAPDGVPWRPGKQGAGDLRKSGKLFWSFRIEERPDGFSLTNRVAALSGQYYGGTHQYGRTMKAFGRITLHRLGADGKPLKARNKRGVERLVPIRGAYATMEGAQPLRWRSPDGRWHSAWKVRVPARPMVPRKGALPARWAAEFERAARAILWRHFTAGGLRAR